MQSADYARITRAILYLEKNFRNPFDAGAALRAAGMGGAAFRRLFPGRAGIGPERFLQLLSVEHARKMLLESKGLFGAACGAGRPATGGPPGRVVHVRAVAPGKPEARGAGWTIRWGVHRGPFGPFFLAATDEGVCALSFLAGRGAGKETAALRKTWNGARVVRDPRRTAAVARRVFPPRGQAPGAPLTAIVTGTVFQLRVWEALVRIPPGFVVSYEDIAARVGAPRAVRAVGSALARNPVAYLIPCHRVIRKTGAFGNYGGGTVRKKAMIVLEAAQREADGSAAVS